MEKLKRDYNIIFIILLLLITGCGKTEEVQWSIKEGVHNEPVEIYIKNMKKFTSVICTFDGSNPSKNSFLSNTHNYKGERWKLDYNKKLKIKYIAFKRFKRSRGIQEINFEVLYKCENPVAEIRGDIVILKNKKDEKIMYSLNGSEYERYERRIQLKEKQNEVKFYAYKEGMSNSDIITEKVEVKQEGIRPRFDK